MSQLNFISSWSLAWIPKCNCFRNGCSSSMHSCMPVFFTTCKYHALDRRKPIIVLPFTVDEILKDRRVTKFQSNNGTRVSSACSNNNCTVSCAAELQTLISDVGCCVRSSAYTFLMADSLFSICRITMPDFCPHPFNSAITTAAAYTSLFTTFIATFMFKECCNELTCSAQ